MCSYYNMERPKQSITVTKEMVNNIIDENLEKMDDRNKQAAQILKTGDMMSAVKHMFTHPRTGKPMTYSQMRDLYG